MGSWALLGVVSFAIIGMFYKIIPFLVWYGSYSRQIGLRKVPSLADLYSPGLQAVGYWAYVAGLAATTIAIVLGNAVGGEMRMRAARAQPRDAGGECRQDPQPPHSPQDRTARTCAPPLATPLYEHCHNWTNL